MGEIRKQQQSSGETHMHRVVQVVSGRMHTLEALWEAYAHNLVLEKMIFPFQCDILTPFLA